MLEKDVLLAEKRVVFVIDCLAKRKTRGEMLSLMDQDPIFKDLSTRQRDRYRSKGREMIDGLKSQKYEDALNEALMDYRFLYKEAIDKKDYRLALSIRKELDSFMDLKKENKREEKATSGDMPQVLKDQLEAVRLEMRTE